jgi:tetratricopeptide (TPR) repeat protein
MRRTAPIALLLALAGAAAAAPRGYVELKDGRKWQDVEFEYKGNRLYVKFKSGAMTDVPTSDVVIARAEGAQSGGGGPAEPADKGPDQPSTVDGASRFKLEPPEGWEPIATPSPLVRVLLKHHQRDATLGVFVRRAAAPIELGPDGQLPQPIADDVREDFTGRYAAANGGEPQVARLHDTPVLRIEGTAKEFGSDVERKVVELRFRRYGLEYAISYSVAPDDEGALAHQVERLFESFSFLPTFQATPERYVDYGRGFGVSRPNGDWVLTSLPFDEEAPARLATKDGRAEVTFQLHASTDAEAVLRGLLTKRQQSSRHFTGGPLEDVVRGVSTVKQFRFEDFNPGGRKKLLFKGFGVVLGGRVLVVTGVLPVADEDAKKLEGDIDAVIGGVQLFDEEGLRTQVGAAQNALTLLKQGAAAAQNSRYDEAIAKYDEAIKLYPGFARAYYLRGVARQGKQDYKGYREDLVKASDLDPSARYDAELSESFEKEAELLEQNRQFAEAIKLRAKVWKGKKSEERLRKLLETANAWWDELKQQDPDKGLPQVEAQLKGLSDPLVTEFLYKTIMDGARALQQTNVSKAKKWANSAKRLASTAEQKAEAEALLDQLKQTGG